MTDTPTAFADMNEPEPDYGALAKSYKGLESSLDRAKTVDDWLATVDEWDSLRRQIVTWHSLTHLRFQQDTQNGDYREGRERCDELTPRISELDVRIKKRLLASEHREAIEARLGTQAFSLWAADISAFDPVIQDDLVAESRLEAKYTELMASAKLSFRGESMNLSGIVKYTSSADRETRLEAEQVRWRWFEAHADEFDQIFDDLVKLRDSMARKLGHDGFTPLAYQRRQRIGYKAEDVERFRQQVRDEVVPIAQELRRQQAKRLGVDPLLFWDEAVFDPRGNPKPQGDHDWMMGQARKMFSGMSDELGEFFGVMADASMLDLKTREGKAGGGFCVELPVYGTPFIFANFNGTKHDVEVFTHEAGHAFQMWKSRGLGLADYLVPTLESAEVHSMSLEFLTWPFMNLFFGDDAQRFCQTHLAESLLFLPYGVAVDHFQHLVYERPNATPDERHEMWQEMERTYTPWRQYDGMPHVAKGALWQKQLHIYRAPFYYIDYVLAQTCALQFWARSEQDRDQALADYVELCGRGGQAAFQELVESAGLISPFKDGCLTSVVEGARRWLKL